MKSIYNFIVILGIAVMAISCAAPEDPTPGNQVIGDWSVEEYFVNGESENSAGAIDRMTLERDGSFIVVDDNGLITVGSYEATETSLVLTDDAGAVAYSFEVVFQTYEKMQLLQTITSPTVGDLVIRYLMNSSDNDTY